MNIFANTLGLIEAKPKKKKALPTIAGYDQEAMEEGEMEYFKSKPGEKDYILDNDFTDKDSNEVNALELWKRFDVEMNTKRKGMKPGTKQWYNVYGSTVAEFWKECQQLGIENDILEKAGSDIGEEPEIYTMCWEDNIREAQAFIDKVNPPNGWKYCKDGQEGWERVNLSKDGEFSTKFLFPNPSSYGYPVWELVDAGNGKLELQAGRSTYYIEPIGTVKEEYKKLKNEGLGYKDIMDQLINILGDYIGSEDDIYEELLGPIESRAKKMVAKDMPREEIKKQLGELYLCFADSTVSQIVDSMYPMEEILEALKSESEDPKYIISMLTSIYSNYTNREESRSKIVGLVVGDIRADIQEMIALGMQRSEVIPLIKEKYKGYYDEHMIDYYVEHAFHGDSIEQHAADNLNVVQLDMPIDQNEPAMINRKHRKRYRNEPGGQDENLISGINGGDGYGNAFKGVGTENPGDTGTPNTVMAVLQPCKKNRFKFRVTDSNPCEDVLGDQETRETQTTNQEFYNMEWR